MKGIDRRMALGSMIGGMASVTLATRAWAQGVRAAADDPDTPEWPPAEHVKLWPGLPPGATGSPPPRPNNTMNGPAEHRELWLRGIAEPLIGVYRPQRPDGRAVLVIPGGGYGFVSVQNEGINVAHALTGHGITAFVLAYRLPGEGWRERSKVPLQDAQRAMRLIRTRAKDLEIDPDRLGLVGFSAGGHLGAMLAVGFADAVYRAVDEADEASARPVFSGLAYPVVSFSSAGLNRGSETMLLGDRPAPGELAINTPVNRLRAGTPPLFLLHAADDPVVPITQSRLMETRARALGIPVETRYFDSGGHGFGIGSRPGHPARGWIDDFADWTARVTAKA